MRTWWVVLGLMAGRAWAQEEPSPPEKQLPQRELGLQVGHALSYDDAEDFGMAGLGFRLQWLEYWGQSFALGPEVAWYNHAGSSLSVQLPNHDYIVTHKPLLQLGVAGRFGWTRGIVRPALLMGLGWYHGRFSALGCSAGAELAVRPTERVLLVLDARYHLARDYDGHYRTLGLGTRMEW